MATEAENLTEMAIRTPPMISVVTSVYRSEQFLAEFIRLTELALQDAGFQNSHEIIFVNDSSPDRSLQYLIEARKTHSNIKIVDLSRNFGHHKALIAGMSLARGNLVFLIDCDLEVSPSVIKEFAKIYEKTDVDVVYGVQEKRTGTFLKRVGGHFFWWFFNRLSDTIIPLNVVTERLLSRRYVDALLSLGDRNIFLGGMMYWSGFEQLGVVVQKSHRTSASSYSFYRRLALFIEAITSFSVAPLRMVLLLGLIITSGACLFAVYLLAQKLISPDQIISGYTSLMVAVLGMGGLIVTVLGIIGLYISRIFTQTQNRPLYIIRKLFD